MRTLVKQAKQKGYIYFDWNVDSGDASGNGVAPSIIINNVLSQSRNKKQVVVLMHETSAKSTTVTALPSIIEGLRNMGFTFQALNENSYCPQFYT